MPGPASCARLTLTQRRARFRPGLHLLVSSDVSGRSRVLRGDAMVALDFIHFLCSVPRLARSFGMTSLPALPPSPRAVSEPPLPYVALVD